MMILHANKKKIKEFIKIKLKFRILKKLGFLKIKIKN